MLSWHPVLLDMTRFPFSAFTAADNIYINHEFKCTIIYSYQKGFQYAFRFHHLAYAANYPELMLEKSASLLVNMPDGISRVGLAS